MANALKCLEEEEQQIKELSQQKEQTNIEWEVHFRELQVCFEEQQGIIENLQKQNNKNIG